MKLHNSFLMSALCLTMSCTDVATEQTLQVSEAVKQQDGFTLTKLGEVETKHIVYRLSKYPLELFTKRLMKGEFKKSLSSFDLSYKSSNVDNKAIEKLLKEGLIPVYVGFTNYGSQPLKVSNVKLSLVGDSMSYSPISVEELPKVLKEYNIKALGANLVNLSVFVVSTAFWAIAAVPTTIMNSGNMFNLRSVRDGGKHKKDTKMTTNIQYKDVLLDLSTVLEKDKTYGGMVFFKIDTQKHSEHDLTLKTSLKK